jgi:hypothetical protein
MSLFGLPMNVAMKMAKNAGFDGIEVLLNHWYMAQIPHYRNIAQDIGLNLHFHQAWSSEEDPTDWRFTLMEAARYLPQSGYALEDNVPFFITKEPVVIDAGRLLEIKSRPTSISELTRPIPNNYWFQTDTVVNSEGYRLIYFDEFAKLVQQNNLPVVFDTQHCLEWTLGRFRRLQSIAWKAHIESIDLITLMKAQLKKCWEQLGPHTKEIHLNDFNPITGKGNLFPGEGLVPLQYFCDLVKKSGWQGVVVPEVSPSPNLWRYNLKILRERTESYFI